MKKLVVLIVVAVFGVVGWRLVSPTSPEGPAGPTGEPPSAVTTDPAKVFQRAFWRRPGPDDALLHAERREWADDEGLTRWQWFLAVEPSAELRRHLFEQNAFGLTLADGPTAPPPGRPDWYPRETAGLEVHGGGGGEMTVLFDPRQNRLYATGAGGGFTRGAPAPPRPAPTLRTASAGRLPNASPPDPAAQ